MAKPKFTFKREPRETGLASVGNPYASVIIKLGGLEVGRINPPTWSSVDSTWSVTLAIKQENTWHWRTFKTKFNSEDEARAWVKEHSDKLLELDLYVFPND